jgi:hypothetical protein
MVLSRRAVEPSVMRHRKVAQGAMNTIGWMLLEFGSYDPSIEVINPFPHLDLLPSGVRTLSKEKGVILHMYKEEEYTYKENDILFTRRCILGVWTAGATGAIWWGRRLFLYYSRMTCFYLFFRPWLL